MNRANIAPVIIIVPIQINRVKPDCKFAFLKIMPKIIAGIAEQKPTIKIITAIFTPFILFGLCIYPDYSIGCAKDKKKTQNKANLS